MLAGIAFCYAGCSLALAGSSRYAELPTPPAAEAPTNDNTASESSTKIEAISNLETVGFDAPSTPDVVQPQPVSSPPYDPMANYTTPNSPHLSFETSACDRCSHWFTGVSVGVTRIGFVNGVYAVSDDKTSASVRPYLGWESYQGVGFRVRAWLYGVDPIGMTSGTGMLFPLEIESATLDFELYKRFQVDTTAVVLGAGSRAARIAFAFQNGSEDDLTAGGLSAFTEISHPFLIGPNSEWSWVGGGKISVLNGEAEFDNLVGYSSVDGSMSIVEANIGLQYRGRGPNADFLFQLLLEEQLWDTNAHGQITFSTASLGAGWEW